MMTWAWPDSSVVRVVDGDSFVAELRRDLGFHGMATFTQRLRLAGVNAPPLPTVDGTAAAVALRDLLVPGPVLIETLKPYKFGDEWMAKVTLADGRDVSQAMVEAGYAVFWDGKGARPGG